MRSGQLGQLRVAAALALSVGMALALTGAFGLESRAVASRGDTKKAEESWFGDLSKLKSVIFVVDKSGSMDPFRDHLRPELAKVVNGLTPEQRFNVIWFGIETPILALRAMVPATDEIKKRMAVHLGNIRFTGSTVPVPAMNEALAIKPELIVFVSDGNFEPEFVDLITAKNAGRCRINVVGIVIPRGEGHDNLAKLAKKNGGTYKAIDAVKLVGE